MIFAIEGPNGVGKTTVIRAIKQEHPDWFYTREPDYDGACGGELHKWVYDGLSDPPTPEMAAAMFAVNRFWQDRELQCVNQTIIKDRCILSNYIFQGMHWGTDRHRANDSIDYISRLSIKHQPPRKIFILLEEPGIIADRIAKRGEDSNSVREEWRRYSNVQEFAPLHIALRCATIHVDQRPAYQIADLIIGAIDEILRTEKPQS